MSHKKGLTKNSITTAAIVLAAILLIAGFVVFYIKNSFCC